MPSINTSDVTRASDSTYYVDIARVKKLNTYLLTYLIHTLHADLIDELTLYVCLSVVTSEHCTRCTAVMTLIYQQL